MVGCKSGSLFLLWIFFASFSGLCFDQRIQSDIDRLDGCADRC
jgi:hypothetical protein